MKRRASNRSAAHTSSGRQNDPWLDQSRGDGGPKLPAHLVIYSVVDHGDSLCGRLVCRLARWRGIVLQAAWDLCEAGGNREVGVWYSAKEESCETVPE